MFEMTFVLFCFFLMTDYLFVLLTMQSERGETSYCLFSQGWLWLKRCFQVLCQVRIKTKWKPNITCLCGGIICSVTLVTCVVVAEVTFSAVTVSGDMTGSFSWTPALTCSPSVKGEVTYTYTHTHKPGTNTQTTVGFWFSCDQLTYLQVSRSVSGLQASLH